MVPQVCDADNKMAVGMGEGMLRLVAKCVVNEWPGLPLLSETIWNTGVVMPYSRQAPVALLLFACIAGTNKYTYHRACLARLCSRPRCLHCGGASCWVVMKTWSSVGVEGGEMGECIYCDGLGSRKLREADLMPRQVL